MSGSARSESELVAGGKVAAADVVGAALDRADNSRSGPGGLNALLWRDDATARIAARDVAGGRLAGQPVVVKDNISTIGLPTTCGSRILEGYLPPFDATVITKLRRAGAVIIGKSNMDEFAMGSSTENSAYGPTLNPVDESRVPGGSSGGSAAAVAAGITRIALGSETGGSVRQPAAFCGVVGVKPTYGRVSRFGLVAYASSLDGVGVFGRTVDDAALALEVISGADDNDSTSGHAVVPDYSTGATGSLAGVVIGMPREYFPAALDPAIRSLCDRAAGHLRSLGAEVREVSLPHTELAIPVYYIIAPAEASSNLARFDGVRYGSRAAAAGSLREMYDGTRSKGFGPEVTRRILLGTYVLSAGYYDAYYRKAQQVRGLIAKDFADVFASGVDLLFTPTTPGTAFPLGAVTDPYEMYLSDIFTVTANLAGVPAMSLPIGRAGGLPVGGQLIAPHYGEADMFAAAYALERELGEAAHA